MAMRTSTRRHIKRLNGRGLHMQLDYQNDFDGGEVIARYELNGVKWFLAMQPGEGEALLKMKRRGKVDFVLTSTPKFDDWRAMMQQDVEPSVRERALEILRNAPLGCVMTMLEAVEQAKAERVRALKLHDEDEAKCPECGGIDSHEPGCILNPESDA